MWSAVCAKNPNMKKNPEKKYMMLAVKEALKAKDRTYPNPMVGAVVVKRGRVIGGGYHRRAGDDLAIGDAVSGRLR